MERYDSCHHSTLYCRVRVVERYEKEWRIGKPEDKEEGRKAGVGERERKGERLSFDCHGTVVLMMIISLFSMQSTTRFDCVSVSIAAMSWRMFLTSSASVIINNNFYYAGPGPVCSNDRKAINVTFHLCITYNLCVFWLRYSLFYLVL